MPEWAQILLIIFAALFILTIIIYLLSGIKKVNESYFFVVERLGKYNKHWEKGIHFMFPLIDRIAIKENFKEKVLDFPAQIVITKDNATAKVDTVVYLKIVDPKLFTYGAETPIRAVENLTATTLRNLLGELDLDQCLTSRETVNSKLTTILDQASDPWGIKVLRVEIQNILPPVEISEAMAKQMQAERNKRAEILNAEGEKTKKVLEAEGDKESILLRANAEKQAKILSAEAEKKALILKAEAEKETINLLNSTSLNQNILVLKALEQLGVLAEGKATKIILPPDLSSVAKVMALLDETNKEIKK